MSGTMVEVNFLMAVVLEPNRAVFKAVVFSTQVKPVNFCFLMLLVGHTDARYYLDGCPSTFLCACGHYITHVFEVSRQLATTLDTPISSHHHYHITTVVSCPNPLNNTQHYFLQPKLPNTPQSRRFQSWRSLRLDSLH